LVTGKRETRAWRECFFAKLAAKNIAYLFGCSANHGKEVSRWGKRRRKIEKKGL